MAKVKTNKSFIDSTEKAFRQTMFRVGASFTQVISDPNAFSGFPSQDIVDTGRFRASQRLVFPRNGLARFSWNTEYAIYLLRGYQTRSGTRVQGRDWIAEGIKRCPLDETLKEELQKNQ